MNIENTKQQVKSAADEAAHSSQADKLKGRAGEVIGSVKQTVGSLIGDDKLELEGRVQNAEGKKDRLKGEIKEVIEDVTGHVKAGIEVIQDKLHGR